MLKVTCAIIEDNERKVLAAQRSAKMDLPYKWEFPGGKLEKNESPEECLKREIEEELSIEVEIVRPLDLVEHSYPNKDILLIPYVCSVVKGAIGLKEHRAFKWLEPEELNDLDWAEADIPVLHNYLLERCKMEDS